MLEIPVVSKITLVFENKQPSIYILLSLKLNSSTLTFSQKYEKIPDVFSMARSLSSIFEISNSFKLANLNYSFLGVTVLPLIERFSSCIF